MKLGFACFLMLTVLVRASLGSSALRCAQLNPFIDILRSSGVNILMHPAVDSSSLAGKCSAQWSAKGTCCGYQSLVNYAANDRKSIGQFSESLSASMRAMQGFFNRIKEVAAAAKDLKALNNNDKIKPLREFISHMNSDKSREYNELWVARFGDKLQLLNDGGNCLDKVHELRAGSLCSICSAQSSGWFLGNRAVVSHASCESVLQPCKIHLEFLAQYFQGIGDFIVRLYKSNLHLVEIGTTSKQLKDSSALIKKLLETLGQARLVGQVSEYMANPSVQNTANICFSFISLAGPSFTEELSLIFRAAQHFMDQWLKHAEHLISLQQDISFWAIMTSSNGGLSNQDFERLIKSIKLPGNVITDKDSRIKDGVYQSNQATAETFVGNQKVLTIIPNFRF